MIGVGFMRTGTMTMQAALPTLGYPCYHMKEVPRERGHLDAWLEFVTGPAPMDRTLASFVRRMFVGSWAWRSLLAAAGAAGLVFLAGWLLYRIGG